MFLLRQVAQQIKIKPQNISFVAHRICSAQIHSRVKSDPKRKIYEEGTFMRKVLKRTHGCALFNVRTFERCQKDETVLKLGSFIKSKYCKSTYDPQLFSTIEDECIKKHKNWPMNTNLHVLDALHWTERGKHSDAFECLLSFFLKQFNELPNGPAVQVMYYIAQSRRQLNSSEAENVIKAFERNVKALTFEETGIYCLALFKNGTDVKNTLLVTSLLDHLLATSLRKYDEVAVAGVLKAVRSFSDAKHIQDLEKLQKVLVPYAKQCSSMSLTHVIRLGLKQRLFHPDLIDIILQRFLNNMNELRIKEVEGALLVISMCNRGLTELEREFCDSALQRIMNSLDDDPERLIRCISYLAVCRVANPELIDWALDPKTHASIYGDTITDDFHNILVIDAYAKINLRDTYTGHKLSEHLCAELMQRMNEETGEGSKMGAEIAEILQASGMKCILSRPFPYVPFPDIFLHSDSRTANAIKPNPDGTIMTASDLHENEPGVRAIAILPCTQRQTVFGSDRVHGFFKLKIDQLQKLGFITIVIKQWDWKACESVDAKRRFLIEKIRKIN